MSEIEKVDIEGNVITHDKEYTHGFVDSTVGIFTFDFGASSNYPQTNVMPFYNGKKLLQPMIIGDYRIIPNGEINQYPDEIREMLEENNQVSANTKTKAFLGWGQAPALYEVSFEDGKRVKKFDSDPEIEKWLNDWEFERYLEMASTEFYVANGFYTVFYRNLGARIGEKAFIAKLKCIQNKDARLEWYDDNKNVNAIIVGDFARPWEFGLKRYPIWDRMDPFALPYAMRYSNMYSFAMDNEYTRAPFHGTRNWIKLGTSIAILLMSFNDNSAAIKYHVEVPAIYWEQKKKKLIDKCKSQGIPYTDKMYDKMKDEVMAKFIQVLSSYKNVGKLVQTDTIFHDEAKEFIGWKITAIDQKIKDYVDAQLNIAKHAGLEISSGMDLHPALSNITREGNLSGGSEQLYAFKLYLMTHTAIPEMIIMKDINDAIAANFPGTKKKMGFYHETVLTEEMTKPADRTKNKQP